MQPIVSRHEQQARDVRAGAAAFTLRGRAGSACTGSAQHTAQQQNEASRNGAFVPLQLRSHSTGGLLSRQQQQQRPSTQQIGKRTPSSGAQVQAATGGLFGAQPPRPSTNHVRGARGPSPQHIMEVSAASAVLSFGGPGVQRPSGSSRKAQTPANPVPRNSASTTSQQQQFELRMPQRQQRKVPERASQETVGSTKSVIDDMKVSTFMQQMREAESLNSNAGEAKQGMDPSTAATGRSIGDDDDDEFPEPPAGQSSASSTSTPASESSTPLAEPLPSGVTVLQDVPRASVPSYARPTSSSAAMLDEAPPRSLISADGGGISSFSTRPQSRDEGPVHQLQMVKERESHRLTVDAVWKKNATLTADIKKLQRQLAVLQQHKEWSALSKIETAEATGRSSLAAAEAEERLAIQQAALNVASEGWATLSHWRHHHHCQRPPVRDSELLRALRRAEARVAELTAASDSRPGTATKPLRDAFQPFLDSVDDGESRRPL